MSRVYYSTRCGVKDHLVILRNALEGSVIFLLVEALNLGDKSCHDLRVVVVSLGIGLSDNGCDVEHDHRVCKRLHIAGRGVGLRRYLERVGRRVLVHTVYEIKVFLCLVKIAHITRRLCVLGVCNNIEGLGEPISSLAKRQSLLGNGKVHSAICIYALFPRKVDSRLCHFEKLGVLLNVVIKIGEHPAASALHPDALVVGIDFSLSVKAVNYAAVLLILGVIKPERHAGVKKLILEEPSIIVKRHALIHLSISFLRQAYP